MKRKRVEAWANEYLSEPTGVSLYRYESAARAGAHADCTRVAVPLREVRPEDRAAAAVVRAAVDVVAWHDPEGNPRALTLSEAEQRMRRAVEKYLKAKGDKR